VIANQLPNLLIAGKTSLEIAAAISLRTANFSAVVDNMKILFTKIINCCTKQTIFILHIKYPGGHVEETI